MSRTAISVRVLIPYQISDLTLIALARYCGRIRSLVSFAGTQRLLTRCIDSLRVRPDNGRGDKVYHGGRGGGPDAADPGGRQLPATHRQLHRLPNVGCYDSINSSYL